MSGEKTTTNQSKDDKDGKDDSNTSLMYQSIREGSVEMKFPADQASTVFYNPVQVQNRDLSILMIIVWAEQEWAVQRAVAAKKRQLVQQQKESGQKLDNFQQLVREYQQSLNASNIWKELAAITSSVDDKQGEGLTILDALAASGLRSIRYWNEIPGVRHVTINDLDAAAVERARHNLQHNQLDQHIVENDAPAKSKTTSPVRPRGIRVQQGDAVHEMYTSRYRSLAMQKALPDSNMQPPWDVIDLDPYGSAAPFLDAAVQAANNGALLCVTCTDMAALGGSHPETCYGRYGSIPIQRAPYLQELALRILLSTIAQTAAKYGRTITPRLSVGMNFYIRVFVTVHDNKAGVNDLSQRIGKVYQCTQCNSFHVVADSQMGGKNRNVYQAARAPFACEEEGSRYKVGGPLWMGPLHDTDMLKEALRRLESTGPESKPNLKYIATKDRLRGLLQMCSEELPDSPLFYRPQDMASLLKVSAIPLDDVRSAIINAGHRVSGYHKDPQAIKTDAPNHVMWDIMRAWCQKHPPKKPPPEGSTGAKILEKKSTIQVDFTRPKQGLKKRTDVARFPMNPEANWGPKKAATGHKRKAEDTGETECSKELKN